MNFAHRFSFHFPVGRKGSRTITWSGMETAAPPVRRRYVIGAYANSPCLHAWNADAESIYYEGLKAIDGIRDLEHPFYGTLHRDDDAWFLDHVKPEWDYVLTCIPGTMQRLAQDPAFGLASTDEGGRQRALEFQHKAREAVVALNRHLGRQAVMAVQIHSAPTMRTGSEASIAAFARSLAEIVTWDWRSARLVIEHCDAFTHAHQPDKGFLSVDHELEAIASLPLAARPGMMVNWGRSAIEGRSVDTPVLHIEKIRAAGALRGLIFSGATATGEAYGAWKDMHIAPAPAGPDSVLAPQSLMTRAEISRSIRAAGPVDYLGAKVRLLPEPANIETRLRLIRETIEMLDSAGA